jgi:hypothetical protein
LELGGTKITIIMESNANSAVNKLIKGLYFNQNLITLIVSLTALGFGKHLNSCYLTYAGLIMSVVSGISVTITTFAYTVAYCMNKLNGTEEQNLILIQTATAKKRQNSIRQGI